MRRLLRLLDPVLQARQAEVLVRAWVSAVSRQPPDVALRRLLRAADALLARVDVLAIELDGGVHAKHRIMRYHDFFLDRVGAGELVLDVGCGKGELAYDLATRGGARVTGIDVNTTSLAFARERFRSERLELVEADALEWVPPRRFDVIVLSNVLEHVADRVGLLRRLVELAEPNRLLIRVPVLERDWLVGLRRDLGLPHFSDPTHETEYSPEQLEAELREAGLELAELEQRWGELWAVARPA
ncbi:MAG TPA: class I SAM-dependent methyltransferase [Gaiellaceae bacterium]|nr:class I SAM-dependent methyltransferase [Gaiellaceae bacterium]